MIVDRNGADLFLVTQADHARLAAELGRAWGWYRPEPFDHLLHAAHRHDDGWIAWDADPELDAEGRLHDFRTVPAATRVAIYRRGSEMVSHEPLEVRALVSLHLTGLFLGRYEAGRERRLDQLSSEESPEVRAFVDEHSRWQDGLWADLPKTIWDQYRLLQALDVLSLSLCLAHEQPHRSVGSVPTGPEESSDIEVKIEGDRVTLAPFPFEGKTLRTVVIGKVIRAKDQTDRTRHRKAPLVRRDLLLVPG